MSRWRRRYHKRRRQRLARLVERVRSILLRRFTREVFREVLLAPTDPPMDEDALAELAATLPAVRWV